MIQQSNWETQKQMTIFQKSKPPDLYQRSNNPDPCLCWSQIQPFLEAASLEVWILLDTCNSASSITSALPLKAAQYKKLRGGRTKLLAACGHQNVASKGDLSSFTKSLEILIQAAGEMYLESRFPASLRTAGFHPYPPTPVHIVLRESDGDGIRLRGWDQRPLYRTSRETQELLSRLLRDMMTTNSQSGWRRATIEDLLSRDEGLLAGLEEDSEGTSQEHTPWKNNPQASAIRHNLGL
ncbi:hypothetical protein BJ878DRAFT_129661 [Calycina marina]|uniref:Uncharacterized protein n=1 Tax=Calycina marina TaxID=1763456 RepID=A0A9P7Z9J2_9HELO|nr:hypothetical protein BJ878DRAFT_129661 [Calycina marina]